MKKGNLTQEKVAAALKDSRYSVTSFKPVVMVRKKYTINVSGMT